MSNMARKNRGRTVALRDHRIDGDGWDDTPADPTTMFIPLARRDDIFMLSLIEHAASYHRLAMPQVAFLDDGVSLQFRSREEADRFRELPTLQIVTD